MLYIHIPFCKSRCVYCSFFSSTYLERRRQYVSSLCREIETRKDYLDTNVLGSVYFGGGTPSLLDFDDLSRIYDSINKCFTLAPGAEVTIECNADDVDSDFVKTIRCFPFNRVSVGIQSFDDRELRFLNRRHDSRQAKDSVKILQNNGFSNISIDLMYSLPNQTAESWSRTISEALSLDIQHISAYSLMYEKGTKLRSMLESGQITAVAEEDSLLFFKILRNELLNKGFEHYEISNFALPDFYAVHNSGYWNGEKYIGVGASAHSYNGVSRQWNVADIAAYCQAVDRGETYFEQEQLTVTDRYNEFMFLSLRTAKGIDLCRLERLFGVGMLKYCMANADKFLKNNLLTIVDNRMCLTEEGIFVSDGIMSSLIKL